MTKDELIKATQILQKHVPNRFPLENPYINAMQEYADQETERLKAELNELKERHKGDIENAYVYAAIDWSDRFLVRSDVEPYAEKYYKQKFESND